MVQFLVYVRLVLRRAREDWWGWIHSNIIEASILPVLAALAGYFLAPRFRQVLPIVGTGEGGDMDSLLVGLIWACVAGAATFVWFLFRSPYRIYLEQRDEIERLSKLVGSTETELEAEREGGKPKLSAAIVHLDRILNSTSPPRVAVRVELSNERSQSIAKHWELEATVNRQVHKARLVDIDGIFRSVSVVVDDWHLYDITEANYLKWVALEKPIVAGDMVSGLLLFEFPNLSSESLGCIQPSDFQLSFADITGARLIATCNPAKSQKIRWSSNGPVLDLGNPPEAPSNAN